MKLFGLFLAALLLVQIHSDNWAVLVAGSDGFYNYRHQSDVFHAYQSLIKKGMDPNRIILLAYDDIASSTSNPFPGKVFNKPTYANPGVDVYQGVKIDYKGAYVTPEVFKAVLVGDSAYLAGKGTGRFVNSTVEDNIFIFFSDHGSTGLIAFPSTYMYANDLMTTFNKMRGRYNKLVFYLETCESGSMFVNLPKDQNIYALSAAGTSESSWATYCSPDDVIQGKHIGSCLGDLFSVNFIEDFDATDLSTQTFQTQFEKVKKLTTLSVVNQWGDLKYTKDFVSSVISGKTSSNFLRRVKEANEMPRAYSSTKPYFIKVNYLTGLYNRHPTKENLKQLMDEMNSIQLNDNIFYSLQTELRLTGNYVAENINFDCLKDSIDFFESQCGKMSEYAYQYVKLFAENCETRPFETIVPAINRHCKH